MGRSYKTDRKSHILPAKIVLFLCHNLSHILCGFFVAFCVFLVDQKRHLGYNSTYTSKTGAVNGLLDQDGNG